jgi:hypothetical protein
MTFGGGGVTPAVKFLLIVNTVVFLIQTFFDYRITLILGLVPRLVWEDFYIWQLFT